MLIAGQAGTDTFFWFLLVFGEIQSDEHSCELNVISILRKSCSLCVKIKCVRLKRDRTRHSFRHTAVSRSSTARRTSTRACPAGWLKPLEQGQTIPNSSSRALIVSARFAFSICFENSLTSSNLCRISCNSVKILV